MIFFLLGVEGLSRAIVYLKLDASLVKSVSTWFDFVGGNILVFIPVVLVVTLVIRQVLPIQAGMFVSAVILIPIAESQFINPWIVVFLTSMFSDIWLAPYQCSPYIQVLRGGYGRYYEKSNFMFYNLLISLARVAAAYLSIPYWQWLGII